MIEALVGNSTAEKILLYIANYGEGYISGIADTFQISKSQIRKQLIRLENGGILVARSKGNLRIYTFNPRCSYKTELEVLLKKNPKSITKRGNRKILPSTPTSSSNRKAIMKISKKMTIGEFAAFVASHLQSKGISTVLTGGAVVSIYTENKYLSYDADFISSTDQKTISNVMQELGFERHGKEFRHKNTDFFVEFPSGPLAIGEKLIQAETELDFKGYKLKLLSPTQSVMDRLAAFFHWNDLQCLDQAIWIAEKQPIQISKIKQWAKAEGEENKFNVFLDSLKKTNRYF